MKENVSEELKKVLIKFRNINDINKLYMISILLNHLSNGLINDGNYLDSDEAYENDALVLEPNLINLDNPMNLATELLLLASNKNNIEINPNGIDIEPYIPKKIKMKIDKILSEFYKLSYKDKIDFLIEAFYDISEIQDINNINCNFYELIYNILSYSKNEFEKESFNSLEI